ncbi:MAG: 4Fe-4S binding protein [Bacteroidales bacterium]|nr:4Fe-4S binding protein [Bacteroidales bacterium]
MILYFSGTGNSRYVAELLAQQLKEKVFPIFDISPANVEWSDMGLGIVCPVYSWGIPPLVLNYISSIPVQANSTHHRPIWVVLTCGDETGMAPEMIVDACAKTGLKLQGIWSVIMPNNYVLLPGFDVDPTDVEQQKLSQAPTRIRAIAQAVIKGEEGIDVTRGSWAWIKTKLVYPLFKRWGMIPRKWKWTKECLQCGKCAKACPIGNIEMRGNHPRWHDKCVSCLACYHSCPVHAVSYGNMTSSKGQYECRLKAVNIK